MSSKLNPGNFDCYANATNEEEMFILLGRDPMAGALVRCWAEWREARGEDPAKVAEARACADRLDAWAKKLGKLPIEPKDAEAVRWMFQKSAAAYDREEKRAL